MNVVLEKDLIPGRWYTYLLVPTTEKFKFIETVGNRCFFSDSEGTYDFQYCPDDQWIEVTNFKFGH